VINDLENFGDLIETNALDLAEQCAAQHLHMSDVTKKVLRDLHTSVAGSVEVAVRAVITNDIDAAREVIGMKSRIQEQVTSAELHEARRLVADEPDRVAVYSVEVELIEKLKHVYDFAERMVKTIEQDHSSKASVTGVG
jgi:phosphate:Na+ symporter